MNTNRTIDIFSELRRRLSRFGHDAMTARFMDAVLADNGWFSREDILSAISAIAEGMLARPVLEQWLADYEPSGRRVDVAVIMAGNLPLVGFHDLLCVIVSGNNCFIRPSGKDTVLMEYIVGVLHDIEPDIPIYKYEPGRHYDAVIATGSDNTNRYFRAEFDGIPSLFRGSRYSAAVLDGSESADDMAALAKDTFLYNGMGCRNVSLIFVPAGYDVNALGNILASNHTNINEKYRNTYLNQRAIAAVGRKEYLDFKSFIMQESDDFPDSIGRVNYSYYSDAGELSVILDAMDEKVQCVVSNSFIHSRSAGIGRSQYPAPWDYPDGVDILDFLGKV